MDVLLGGYQKCLSGYFFWNANGRVLPKIQIVEEWVIVSKWYRCSITKQKKKYLGASDIDVLCNTYAIAGAVLIVNFRIMTFMI